MLDREEARKLIHSKSYKIARLKELTRYSEEEAAKIVESMIREFGEGHLNRVSSFKVLKGIVRYYLFVTLPSEDILGVIGVDVKVRKIGSLVVHDKYRRLGIASILLNHALSVIRDEAFGVKRDLFLACAYVRKNNEAGIRFFQRHGFSKSAILERSYMMAKILRRKEGET